MTSIPVLPILCLSLALLPSTPAAGGCLSGSPLPLPEGDWIIATPQVYSDVTIRLRGNLIIQRGGSLELRGVRLRMDGEEDGQRRIEIHKGGRLMGGMSGLTRRRTVIEKGPGPGQYAFQVMRGGKLVLLGASVSGAGWDSFHPGLVIEGPGASSSEDVSFLDCDFENNFVGVTLRGISTSIVGGRFRDNHSAAVVIEGAAVTLRGLEITGHPLGLAVHDSSQVLLEGLSVSGNDVALTSHGADVDLGYSIFVANGLHALFDGAGSVTVHDDVFAAGEGGLVAAGGAVPTLTHNDFLSNGFGVRNQNAPDVATVPARDNYWGAASGPSGAGPGDGDSVSPGVDFVPWCRESCTRPSGSVSGDAS